MSSIFQNLRGLIDKLNQIDVGRELAKLQEINIEDLRNISFSDLRQKANPMMLSAVGSVVLVGVGLSWVVVPEWRSWGRNSQILRQYRAEAEELPLLRVTLNKLQKQQDEIGADFDVVRDFVSAESIELFTSKFFSETALRSSVRLLGVTPMRAGEPLSCIQSDPAFQSFDDSFAPDFPPDSDQTDDAVAPGVPPSTGGSFQTDLSRLFKVNRFQISLRGNYLNVIDYLRYLNQYQQTLSPACLEVFATPITPSPAEISAAGANSEPRYIGDVNVRLVVDIPQREALGALSTITDG